MKWFLSLGLILLVISIVGVIRHSPHSSEAYLTSWSFWLQFPLGAIAIKFLHDLTGGEWGNEAKPILLSLMKTLWWAPFVFIPLLLNSSQVFPWLLENEMIAQYAVLKFKASFYQFPYFALRFVFYFIIFLFICGRITNPKRGPYFPAWGLILYTFTMSFASIDWFMSREPEWYSTVYPLIWIMSQMSSAFSIVLLMKCPMLKINSKSCDVGVNRDQATLYLVFILGWAYLSFMQFLIQWSGNLPKEVSWYLLRVTNGWGKFILLSLLGLLIVPFFLLLNKQFKSNPLALSFLAMMVLIVKFFDIGWIILPSTRPVYFFSYWDFLSFIGIGSLFIWIFLKQLRVANES